MYISQYVCIFNITDYIKHGYLQVQSREGIMYKLILILLFRMYFKYI